MQLGRPEAKPLKWVGSSKHDLMKFPDAVRKEVGYALYLAQIGMRAPKAKPLHGFGGAGVLEVVEDFRGDAYRAVYTVKFRGIVFVLHAFQKKSKRGMQTPKADIEIIQTRLKAAADAYDEFHRSQNQ
jgi:phage-related protein